ncbi:MAG: sensor hybrid histidine kinase [Solirubrobacterales bacterium]|nr:sensor hybrid histidine kinase [Solirubrobacterales bacterium]
MTRLFEASLDAPATIESLRARHELLERLSRIQRSISHGAPLEEVFTAIAAGAAEVLGDPVAGLRLVDEDDPTTMRLVASTGLTPDQLDAVRRGAVGEGAGGRAIAENTVVVVEDYPDTSDGIAQFGEFGVQNALAAPVRVNGAVVGSLTVASFEAGRRYDVVEQEIITALAEHAGLALLDASLIDQRERTVERQGAERFHALVRHTSDLIAIVDAEGVVRFATPSVGRVLGVPTETLLGTTLLAHVHPADRPKAAALLHATAGRPGTMPPSDWRLVPAGTQFQARRWMHVEVLATNLLDLPNVEGIVINARDVTERVLAEQQRRDRDALYRQIVDSTHDGVWMTDPDDRTVFVNDALARMLGRDPAEILGRRPTEFMEAADASVVRAAMLRRRSGVSERYEASMVRADGSPLHIAISGTPMFEDGRFSGALALCGDITELVEARGAKAELEAQLRHAQELETLGRLAGHVAHDFNQVLAVIVGYSDLLRARATDERVREDLGRIAEAADHGAALARQLVMFSRRDQGAPEVLDLAEIARATARLVASTAPAGVRVQAVAGEPLPVNIDPTKLRQILMNLIDNAIDALPDGGTVELVTGEAGNHVSLTVTDDGTGMPADVMARALEPAFTTKPSGSGSGLGLAIVHGAVQSAGGSIKLRSAATGGTSVEVLLPRAEGPARTAATPGADAAGDRPGATILLVEDDVPVLELTRRLLSEHGYAVVSAPDAERALAAAAGRRIDLLLTDQTMPGTPGLELAQQVRELRPGLPAIIMSGYVAEAGAQTPDGVGWLQKPFGAAALLGSVRDALSP